MTVWAGFPERKREGNKFSLAEKPMKQVRRNFCSESVELVKEERRNRQENTRRDFFETVGTDDPGSAANGLTELFGDLGC